MPDSEEWAEPESFSDPVAEKKVIAKIDEKGLFSFEDHMELGVAASMLIQTGFAPDHLKRQGKGAVAAAILLCKQFNLPQKAMNQMASIKGTICCYGSLVTALAERHPAYGEREDLFLDEDQEIICSANKNLHKPVWAAVVKIRKKGSKIWNEYFFTIDDAQRAGLLTERTKADSGWIKYARDLLYHKANKRALNSNYASALEGIEYYEDLKDVYEVVPRRTSTENAEQFNALLERDDNVV